VQPCEGWVSRAYGQKSSTLSFTFEVTSEFHTTLISEFIPNLTKTPPAGMLAQNGGLMTAKPTPTRYFWIMLLALLTACGNSSQAAGMTQVQNTALAIVWTDVALTQTAIPTATLPPPTFTPTNLPTSIPTHPLPPTFTPTDLPTSIPTEPPPPILTPDAIQVERWQEYQTELAKALYSYDPNDPSHQEGYYPGADKDALCEWDILGQSGQEVYVWAACVSADGLWLERHPAVI
jgi:hypothetical protein